VNPVRHVPQSAPTGNTSGGPRDPLPVPWEAGMGRKTLDSRREMGTLGTTRMAELLRLKALRTIWLAELLRHVHSLALACSRTAEQSGGTTDRPGRMMGGDRHVGHGDRAQYLIYPYYLILFLPGVYHFLLLLLLLHKYYTHSPYTLTCLSFLSTLMPPPSFTLPAVASVTILQSHYIRPSFSYLHQYHTFFIYPYLFLLPLYSYVSSLIHPPWSS
jgi:hypothetical protein